jgi:hypothetical protein
MEHVDLVRSGLDEAQSVDGMGTAGIRAKKPGALAPRRAILRKAEEGWSQMNANPSLMLLGSST